MRFLHAILISIIFICLNINQSDAAQKLTIDATSIEGRGSILFKKGRKTSELTGTVITPIPLDQSYDEMDEFLTLDLLDGAEIYAECELEKIKRRGKNAIYSLKVINKRNVILEKIGLCDVDLNTSNIQSDIPIILPSTRATISTSKESDDSNPTPTTPSPGSPTPPRPDSPTSPGSACVIPAPETRTTNCPNGQVGIIVQSRTAQCPGPTWNEWVTQSNSCQTPITIDQAATQAGASFAEVQRQRFANYTDPFTLPETKTECTHIYDTGVPDLSTCTTTFDGCASKGPFGICLPGATTRCDNIKACDTYATYKRVMNCDWYIDIPISSGSLVTIAKDAAQTVVNDFINFSKSAISSAIVYSLGESGVAAAAAGFASAGAGAGPAFIATLETVLPIHLGEAKLAITNYLATVPAIQLQNLTFKKITTDNISQACVWSEWSRL